MHRLSLPSYAKINLGLTIKGKRPDGFHEIETILQQISLKDEIEISTLPHNDTEFTCSDGSLPTDDDNLCVRAAQVLRKKTHCQLGAKIALTKNIPFGAGLGGGSSNAAAVLLALNKLWDLDLRRSELEEIAACIGSDVPFFIEGGTALAVGRGERLETLPGLLENKVILVAVPDIRISTQWAYSQANLILTKKKKYITLTSFKGRNINKLNLFASTSNDFEEIVFPAHRKLGELKRRIGEKAEYASLSGSGSAVYGIFNDEEAAKNFQSAALSQVKTFVTRAVKWGYSELHELG